MKELLKKFSYNVFYTFLTIVVFVYIAVAITTIPSDYTIRIVDNELCPTYPIGTVFERINDKFISIVKFDIGRSSYSDKPLDYLVYDILLNSLTLVLIGILVGLITGIAKGIIDSRKSKADSSSFKVLLTIIPISLPDLLIIALLQRLALYLNKNGIKIVEITGDTSLSGVILPVLALSILPASYIARITSMAIEDCYGKNYIRTALGKGCSDLRVLWNHVMRNAIISVIESLPSIVSMIIGNMIMVEYLFSYPGLTYALFKFFDKSDINGTLVCVLLIGLIYFIIDSLFKLLKFIIVGHLRGKNI